jgi:cytochrome c biogenesis protein CcmG/thiol:disulfide interchange protein DsbE
MTRWAKVVGLVVASLVVFQLLYQRATPPLDEARPAPPLALPDLNGRTIDLAAMRGKVVAVNFWATWCPPCKAEIPELAALWRAQRDRCFEILAVTEDSPPEEIARAMVELGIPYPVVVDPDGKAADRYGVPGFPRTYLVDTEGVVRQVFEGAVRRSTLEEALRPLLPPAGTCPRA